MPRWLIAIYALLSPVFLSRVGVLTVGVLLGYRFNLPQIQALEDYRPDVITDIYSDDSKVIGEFAVERRIIVAYDDIPANLQNALLAAEDDQFFHHSGINYFAIMRAAYKDLISMSRAEGASTITPATGTATPSDTPKSLRPEDKGDPAGLGNRAPLLRNGRFLPCTATSITWVMEPTGSRRRRTLTSGRR